MQLLFNFTNIVASIAHHATVQRGKLKEHLQHSRQKEPPPRLRVAEIAFGTVLFLPLAFYLHAIATQVNG